MKGAERVRLRVHPLFWLVIALGLIGERRAEIVLLFTLVLAHELAHAIVAEALGYRVRSIVLLPFGGALEADPPPLATAREEALVAIAGPFVHLPLLVVGAALAEWGILPGSAALLWQNGNAALLAANLLPLFPLDGGRILQSALTLFMPYRRALVISYGSTMAMAWALLALFIRARQDGWAVASLSLWLIVVFAAWTSVFAWRALPVTMAAFWTARRVFATDVRRYRLKVITVYEPLPIVRALSLLFRERYHRFVCRPGPRRVFAGGRTTKTSSERPAESATRGYAVDEFELIDCLSEADGQKATFCGDGRDERAH